MLQSSNPRPTIASLLSVDSLPLISNLLFSSDSDSPSSTALTAQSENQKSVTFAEPGEIVTSSEKPSQTFSDEAVSSTDTRSQSASGNADITQITSLDEQNKKNKAVRTRTTYSLAYPHPTPWRKLHIRPRKYLQLQQWTGISSRPLPTYEVLPASCFSATSRKANAKFRRMSRWRNCFGPDEMFVTRAGEYSSAANAVAAADSASISSDESVSSIVQDPGAAIAALCAVNARQKRDGVTADLALDDETVWEATPLANNGGYEFVWTDDHGLRTTVRWVARNLRDRPRQQRAESWTGNASKTKRGSGSIADRQITGKRFTFSTIDPQSRRHPVIATLTNSCMEVYDTYTHPTPKVSTIESSSTEDSSREKDDDVEGNKPVDNMDGRPLLSTSSSPVHHTDERIRKLILVSGIWVALQEGWSPNFRYAGVGLPATSRLTRSTSSASFTATPQSPGVSAQAVPAATAGLTNSSQPMRRSRFSSCPSTPLSLSQAADSSASHADCMSPIAPLAQPAITPAAVTTTETHPTVKSTCTSIIRRASTQLYVSPRHLTQNSASEVIPTPLRGISDTGTSSYDLSTTKFENGLQSQVGQESQLKQQIPSQVCSAGTVVNVACVPSSTASPVASAASAASLPPPPLLHHHQTGKLNRVVRGWLVSAVNKMDKHADPANVGDGSHGYVHRHGFHDMAQGMASGQIGDNRRGKDNQRTIKAARRRTIM